MLAVSSEMTKIFTDSFANVDGSQFNNNCKYNNGKSNMKMAVGSIKCAHFFTPPKKFVALFFSFLVSGKPPRLYLSQCVEAQEEESSGRVLLLARLNYDRSSPNIPAPFTTSRKRSRRWRNRSRSCSRRTNIRLNTPVIMRRMPSTRNIWQEEEPHALWRCSLLRSREHFSSSFNHVYNSIILQSVIIVSIYKVCDSVKTQFATICW